MSTFEPVATVTNNVYILTGYAKNLENLPVVKLDDSNYYIELTPADGPKYTTLLDKFATLNFNEQIDALYAAWKYFINYSLSYKSYVAVINTINSLVKSENIWHDLAFKPDYNLTLFRSRTLPYFNLNCNDWVKANIDAKRMDYPAEITAEITADLVKNTFSEHCEVDINADHVNAVGKNNNFLATTVLPYSQYPDIERMIENAERMVEMGMEEPAKTLLCYLMLSHNTAHICKEPRVWQILNNPDERHIYTYCMWYAMYLLKQEETIMFSQVNPDSRVIFTLDQASAMPLYSTIDTNPYIVQLTDDTSVAGSIPFYLQGERRINNKEEFDRRFAIATGNAFANIDLRTDGIAITGSILMPCVHKSPLETLFNESTCVFRAGTVIPEDAAFFNYLEYYYPGYASLTEADYATLCQTAQNMDDIQYTDDDGTYAMPVENKTARNALEYNQLADIDISITTRDIATFKERAMRLYESIKANCSSRGIVYISEVNTIATVKYKLYGPGLTRPMDIFRIPYDPAKMVKKFHLCCVKMYYDNDVKLLRSCVSALLSGVNETYKWFTCNKIPADVILKYAQRGISTIMNTHERAATKLYVEGTPRWKTTCVGDFYGIFSKYNTFFMPEYTRSGIRMNLAPILAADMEIQNNKLVSTDDRVVYTCGDVTTHTCKNIHPPDYNMVRAALFSFNGLDM